jgi:hypothetical protein
MKPTFEKAIELLERWIDTTIGKNPAIPYKLTTDTMDFLRIMKDVSE